MTFEYFFVFSILLPIFCESAKENYQSNNYNFSLFIGIFSARENFEERLSLRRTWLSSIEKLTSLYSIQVKYKFILGSRDCETHPEDRIDNYSCVERSFAKESTGAVPQTSAVGTNRHACPGFYFSTQRKILITHLGVPDCVQLSSRPTRLFLKSIDGKVLASATFMGNTTATKKAIPPLIFPAYSEGVLTADNTDVDVQCCSLLNEGGNIVNVRPVNFQDQSFKIWVPGYFYFQTQIDNEMEVKERALSWRQHIQQLDHDIRAESVNFSDILFVNITDVYRNLPNKLLGLIKEARENNVEFLLKVDDDSFVDLRLVLNTLVAYTADQALFWWWSSFKTFWRVERAGKWREPHYLSMTYPPFPCGGGYVVNRGVVNFISNISKQLKTFQGEDVSLGIWLSTVAVSHPNTTPGVQTTYKALMTEECEWGCEWTCDNYKKGKPLCNLVQMTVDDMYRQWEKYKICGFIT